ncbi:single-stranded nucleic acid binding R3H domain-containing protein [Apostichopus japonicus]|uniref:Single-stranded nucleic acid binding R3H domain-containing protein n=1 Tax=Stichopus japonicus TaxID=307972 RepID=A0A2G8LRE3_STIJA|nr:single-stranded nucleic acid binding R3H domain-containing protein [Apostichopus japonicus]
MASGNYPQEAASHTEQTEVVRKILTEKGQPLSWETFGKLYEERDPSVNYQSVQDFLCGTSVHGILCSTDFIALDTPRNVALLKLELAVVVNEKLNEGKLSTASYYFQVATSEEEKDELGHNEVSLAKSMLIYEDTFFLTSLTKQKINYMKIVLKPGIADRHKSFFRFENDTKVSALHKLKYFLFLCHGSTNVRSAFEYSRCFLTKAEKVHFSRNTTDDFVKALKLQCLTIYVDESAATLSLISKVQNQENPNAKPVIKVRSRTFYGAFPVEISELESRKPDSHGIDFREMFCQSPPNGFLHSPDFVSIYNNVKCSALAKLHFILAVNNKLGNGQLGKISYHFNVLGSEQERDMFGRNPSELSQSLHNHSNIFCVSSEGGNLRSVKCGPLAIPFNTFFQFEGKSKESFCHKLKYFLNLCSGTCTVFAAYEFSRNLLRRDEKQLFMSNQESFIQFVSSLREFFKVTADKIQLLQSHLWRTQLKEASIFPGDMKIQSHGTAGKKDQGSPTSVTKKLQKQPTKALTEDFVKDILKSQGYPMSWTEFKKKFLSLDENPDNTVEEFMKQYSNKVAKSLCMSKDFVALNTPFHRNRLKLQLILENRSRSNKPSKISLMELKEQFEEIASDHEIVETRYNCPSLQEFLLKFPKVFVVKSNFVTQGASALKFLSFFGKEKEGAKPSVMNKLNYFVNICGDYCDISYACKFLQTHLSLKEELELVSSDDKVFDLIKASQGGKMDADVGGQSDTKSNNEVQIDSPTTAISDVNRGVSEGAKANSNGPPPPNESPTMQSKGSDQTVPMPLALPEKDPVNRGVSEGAKANSNGPPPPKESPTMQSKGSDQTVPMPLSLPEKDPTSSMDSDVGSQSDAKSNNEVQIEILEERNSTIVRTLRVMEPILQQRDHPMLWRDLEESGFTFKENRSWIAIFRDLSTLETLHLICTQEFISQNTPKDRAFLKLCLLVRINVKYNGNCPVNTLHEQVCGIGSSAEKKVFNDDFETYLKSFPSVFVMNVDTSSLERVVHPGKDMPCFENLFQLCADHQEDFCLQCQLTFFIYLSGGNSHFNNAFGFTKLIVESAQRGSPKNDQEIETSEFEKLLENCSRVHLGENLDITLSSPSVNSHTGSKGTLTAAIGVSQGAKANIKGPLPTKESPTAQSKGSDQTVHIPLSLPEKGPTSSILPVQGALPSISDSERDVPPTSEEGALSSSSSLKSISSDPTKTKTASKRSKKKKADAAVSMATETKVDVKVEVIGNENRLTMLIAQMLEEVNPIISVMHCQEILIVLNWSGTGFLLPIPPIGGQVNKEYDARWTKLCDFLKNRKVVMVTFDCESVGKVLLERLDLKLGTVFDIKCGVQLLSFESPSNSPTYRNVTEICQSELHSRGALKELESLTKKKLDVMYTEAENESSLAADDSSTSTTTPTPSSYKSSTSLKASHSTGEMKMFPELPGQNTSLQASLSQNSMIVNGGTVQMIPPGQSTSTLSPFSQNSMMLNENQVQWIPPQNDWFSEENDYIPVGSSVLEGSFDQKVYCLRKTEDGDVSPVPQEEANSYDSNLSGLTEELVKHIAEKNSESIIQLLTLLGDDIFTTLGEQLQGQSKIHMDQLSEIVLDVGRCAEARLHKNIKGEKPVVLVASSKVITKKALQEIEENDVLTGFDDNRCGVEGCLHSVRGVRNRMKKLIGLTVRVALPLLGCADMMYDIAFSGRSILILGCPGVGKTTLLRELARCLSDTEKKKVVVIDTYNEIAGDSDTPHFSIGSARRLQVYNPEEQHQVISESAKNHSPEVVIIDQIELKSDVTAATRLPRYGIQVIAGINCDSVMNLIEDQNLSQIFQIRGSNMLDDMQSLDSAGALAQSKVKSAFQALVEMKESDCWHIHDLNHTWTNISAGQAYSVQERTRIGLNHRQPGWEQQIILRETLISPQETFEF